MYPLQQPNNPPVLVNDLDSNNRPEDFERRGSRCTCHGVAAVASVIFSFTTSFSLGLTPGEYREFCYKITGHVRTIIVDTLHAESQNRCGTAVVYDSNKLVCSNTSDETLVFWSFVIASVMGFLSFFIRGRKPAFGNSLLGLQAGVSLFSSFYLILKEKYPNLLIQKPINVRIGIFVKDIFESIRIECRQNLEAFYGNVVFDAMNSSSIIREGDHMIFLRRTNAALCVMTALLSVSLFFYYIHRRGNENI